MQTTRRIEKNRIKALVFRVFNAVLSDFYGISLTLVENVRADFFADNVQLLNRRRTINVARNKERSASLTFEPFREFRAMRCFTRALQAAHHNNTRRF